MLVSGAGGIERGMMKDKDQKWYIDFLCLQYKYYNPNYDAVAEAFRLAKQYLPSDLDTYFALQELLYRFYRKKPERLFNNGIVKCLNPTFQGVGRGIITLSSRNCRKILSGK